MFSTRCTDCIKKTWRDKTYFKIPEWSSIVRSEEERPDIVKMCKKDLRGQRDTVVGIEHFRVDQLSIKNKNGKIASTGIATEKNVRHIFNVWHNEVMRTDKVPDAAVQAIAKGIAE